MVQRGWIGAAFLCLLALLPVGMKQAQAQIAHSVTSLALGSGFSNPAAVAVDGYGNVFVADYGNNAVKEILAGTGGAASGTVSANSTVIPLGVGFNFPSGIAVDTSGNVFVADIGNHAVKEILAGTGGAASGTVNAGSTVVLLGTGFVSPQVVAVDKNGNVFVADFSTTNGSVKEIVAGTGTAASGTVNASSTVNVLRSGFASPMGIAVDANGNVFIGVEGQGFAPAAVKEIVAGTGGAAAGTVNASSTMNVVGSGFVAPCGVAVDASGNVFVADEDFTSVKEIVASGGAVNASSSVIPLGSGFKTTIGVAVDAGGDLFVADFGNNAVKEIVKGAVNFGSVAAGLATPPTQTITFSFDSGGTISAVNVIGFGGGFYSAGTGTCTTNGTSHYYSSGDTCTVDTDFAPNGPGQQLGAVLLVNSGGSAFATVHLVGMGLAPVASFPGPYSWWQPYPLTEYDLNEDFPYSLGLWVNPYGGYIVADSNIGKVYQNSVNNIIGHGFVSPEGVAIDGAGNVYVADIGIPGVKEILADQYGAVSSSSTVITLGSGSFHYPEYLAVDANGDVFVADDNPDGSTNGTVKEIVAGTGGAPSGTVNANSSVVTVGSGFRNPVGVGVDPNGNLLISDTGEFYVLPDLGDSYLKEIVAGPGGVINPNTTPIIVHSLTNQSAAITFDSLGDVFIGLRLTMATSTSALEILAGTGGAASGTINTNSTLKGLYYGGNTSQAVGVDASGNVYLLDQFYAVTNDGGNSFYDMPGVMRRIGFANSEVLTFPSTLDGASSASQVATIVNSGNAPLVFTIPTSGTNPSLCCTYAADYTIDTGSATTCPLMTPSSTVPGTLAEGASCTISVKFTPTATAGAMLLSGLLRVYDNSSGGLQSIMLNGTAAVPTAQHLVFTKPPAAAAVPGSSAGTVAVSEEDYQGHLANGSFDPIKLTVSGPGVNTSMTVNASYGVATFNLNSVILSPAGLYSYIATNDTLGSSAAYQTVAGTSFIAPTESTGTSSGVQTASIIFNANTTLNSNLATAIQVLTKGALNMDFAYATGGTCAAGASYTATQSCTVNFTFTPKFPGQRLGAIVLYDNSAPPVAVATIHLSGMGNAPMVTFPSNTATSNLGSGFVGPYGVALDGNNNVIVADLQAHTVKQIVAGTGGAASGMVNANSTVNVVGSGFNQPASVAVDGAGNVFVAEYNVGVNGAVYEIMAGTGGAAGGTVNATSTVNAVGQGINAPTGVAVDANGNVFVADYGAANVKEIVADSNGAVSSTSTTNVVGAGFTHPYGIALDGNGNVFVSDMILNQVKEIVAGTGGAASGTVNATSTTNSVGSGFSSPFGLTVDASGDVFVADSGNNAIKEIVAGSGGASTGTVNATSTVNTLGGVVYEPMYVTLDGSGDPIYSADGNNTVVKLDLSDPPSLTYAPTMQGLTSAAQTVTVANSGNAPLNIPKPSTGNNPSTAAYFSLDSSASTACPLLSTSSPSAATLAQSATCTLTASFAPTTAALGPVSGSLVLTDNSLAVTGAMQTIALNGVSTPMAPTATQNVSSSTVSINRTVSFTPVTATGGTAPLVYTVSPTLPAGLSISSTTGALTGTATAASPATTYTVTVTDANNRTSTATFSLTIAALTPTLSLTPSPASPSVVNTSVAFTAQLSGTLTPTIPTGTVTFLVNGSASADCPAVKVGTAGNATCTTAKMAAGANTVTATYAGDSNYVVAAAGSASYTVTAAAVTIGLSASPSNSSMVGDTVTFTAQLAGTALTPVVPSGKVNFTASGNPLSGCGAVAVNALGQATCVTSSLVAGSDPITATYSGDSNFTVAAAGTMTQTVTATTTSSASPATLTYSTSAQTVTLSAAVVSGSGTVNVGTVSFSVFNGATQLGSTVASGTVTSGTASAIYTLPAGAAAGSYSIHVLYNPAAPFATSSNSSSLLTVGKATPIATVTPYSVTFDGNAHTAAGTASGVGGVSLSSAGFTLSGTTHTSAGSYASDAWSFTDASGNYATVTGAITDSIAKATPVVTAAPYSVTFDGAAHTATATATGVSSVSLSSAGFTLSGTTHTSAGSYASDAWSFTDASGNYATVTGTITDSIAKATPVVTAAPYSVTFDGAAHTATATATGVSSVSLSSAGFTLSGTTHTNAGGYASDAWSFTDASGNYATVTGTITDGIAKAATGATLASSANPALIGPITLTATVTSTVGVPTGTVNFMDSLSTTPLGQGTISGGVATLLISTLSAGPHSITAVYSGDGNYAVSNSSARTQTMVDFNLNPGTVSGSGSISGTNSTQTVAPGGTVTFPLALLPTSGTIVPAAVSLTVTGMPAGATATITPSTWTQLTGASWSFPANTPLNAITLSVQIPSVTAKTNPSSGLGRALAPLSLALLLLPFAGRFRRAGKRLGRAISVLLLLAIGLTAMTALSGCGSASNGYFSQAPTTYTIHVTATAGTVSRSTDLTLTVQ